MVLTMADGMMAKSNDQQDPIQTLLASFRQVGMPLLQAMTEQQGGEGSSGQGLNADVFSGLVDSTVALSRSLANQLGSEEQGMDAAVRWALAGSSSQVVAAHFRATGKALAPQESARLAEIAAKLQVLLKGQVPSGGETTSNTAGTFRAKMIESMVPVIGAMAQYAFGRAEHDLLIEVSEKLVRTADQMTRSLAPAGATPEQWRLLCWTILRASGQIYTECHYAEADRLLYMKPEDRAAYFTQHGNVVPMTQVWQSFNQRMAMLATLATYLEVPALAKLETQEI